jgi:transposase
VRDARRARVILMAAEGVPSARIAVSVPMSPEYVARWRRRFLESRLEGLKDDPRPGRPRRLGHNERLAIAAVATSAKDPDDPVSTWSYYEIVDRLRAEGTEVSASQVWRILRGLDIDLRRVRGWLNRRDDPEFWDRVRDVCGLYLSPPDEKALVLSIDEKTGIQAKRRVVADQPARPGRARRREFEYRRHGTASLVAALAVHSGEVLARPIARNDSATFCDFLDDIDRAVPPGTKIVVILDNGSSHVSKATRAWLAAHPRFEAHYTPKHASWVNQIELFFSILQRKVIRNGDFASRDDLIDKLLRFIADYDQTARPFAWTYAGQPLKVA